MTRPSSSSHPRQHNTSIYRRKLSRPSSSYPSSKQYSRIDPTLKQILASVARFTDSIPTKPIVPSSTTTKAAAASRRRNKKPNNRTIKQPTRNHQPPLILLSRKKKYRPNIDHFSRPKSSIKRRTSKIKKKNEPFQFVANKENKSLSVSLSRLSNLSEKSNATRRSTSLLDPNFVPSFTAEIKSQITRNHIPQKALESRIIKDAINAMTSFEITPDEINTIVEGLSHSKPKPTPQNNRKQSENIKKNIASNDVDLNQDMFSVRLPKNVIIAKNEARKLATTMTAIERGTAAHDEREVIKMEQRTNRSRSLVRDLRAEDESLDHVCHTKTANLLDLRMQILRNQANQLGLEIRNAEKLTKESRNRNHTAKVLADAQNQQHDQSTMNTLIDLCHGDTKKAMLLVTMKSPKVIAPIIQLYMKLIQTKESSETIMKYSPILEHMLENLKQEYHQASLKTEALRDALHTVSLNLKEFHTLNIAMNHASLLGEDRLDAINAELNLNREERLDAVRLRQENLLAQQRLKRKLAVRERQRRDKKQDAMLTAQKSSHYQQMKGDKKQKTAAVAGMRLMERRLLGKQLLSDEKAKFPKFQDLQRMIGERTNVNVDSPTILLERMLNHTAEESTLERELERLRERLIALNKEVPMLELKVEMSIASTQQVSSNIDIQDVTESTTTSTQQDGNETDGNETDGNETDGNETKMETDTDDETSSSKRSLRQQRRDIEESQAEYNTKLNDLKSQMSLIQNSVSGIHSMKERLNILPMKKMASEQRERDKHMKERLKALLNNMMASSVAPSDDTNNENANTSTATSVTNCQQQTDKIVEQIHLLFNAFSQSLNTVTNSLEEKEEWKEDPEEEREGERERKGKETEEDKDGNAISIAAAPLLLRLSRSTENLIDSINNIRVKSTKFTKELRKGERRRLCTLSRVKTLREARTASEIRPKHALLHAIHTHLQQEQDLMKETGVGSLREEKNGQTIIRSFEDVAFNMDERMDSEDEELEQSRIDLKREIKHLNRRNANVTPTLTK